MVDGYNLNYSKGFILKNPCQCSRTGNTIVLTSSWQHDSRALTDHIHMTAIFLGHDAQCGKLTCCTAVC